MTDEDQRDILAELVRQRIDSAYAGNQREFGRKTGLTPQTVYSLVHGKSKLPTADTRRRIAKELGIRHIDIFVMAGELWPEEIPKEGEPVEPFPEGDPRRKIVEVLSDVPDGDVETVWFVARHLADRYEKAQE